jgi:hypothetical protein
MKEVKKNTNQDEKQRQHARRIWRATQKCKMGGLLQVATQENGQLRTYHSKLDIEGVCGKSNQNCFRWACGRCPFLKEPLLSEFGTLGINGNANGVLQGSYPLPGSVPKWMMVYMNAPGMPLEVRRWV